MKQRVILLSIFFFCGFSTSAQKKISKDTFDKLVDYANLKYVETFIEKHDKEKHDYFETYQKDLAIKLQEASLENLEVVLNFSDLQKQLSNNIPAQKLTERINERKTRFNEYQDDISLINSLSTTGWYNIDLSQTAAKIQNNILSKFNLADIDSKDAKTISEAEVVKTQTIQTSTQVEQLQSRFDQLQQQNQEYQKSLELFKLIVLGGTIFIVLIFGIILYLLKAKSREYIIKQVLNSQRINNVFNKTEEKRYTLSENDINTIENRILERNLLNEKEIKHEPKASKKEIFNNSKPTFKYLKGKSGKVFNRAENNSDNSFFKLFNESDDVAFFEFCGDEAEALARRIFSEDISIIISGNYQNAHSIQTSKPGKIKRVGEQWEVIEPIQIKLT